MKNFRKTIKTENKMIKEGMWFKCTRDVEMCACGIVYRKDYLYKSEKDGCITDDRKYVNHHWPEGGDNDYRKYFTLVTAVPATEEKGIAASKRNGLEKINTIQLEAYHELYKKIKDNGSCEWSGEDRPIIVIIPNDFNGIPFNFVVNKVCINKEGIALIGVDTVSGNDCVINNIIEDVAIGHIHRIIDMIPDHVDAKDVAVGDRVFIHFVDEDGDMVSGTGILTPVFSFTNKSEKYDFGVLMDDEQGVYGYTLNIEVNEIKRVVEKSANQAIVEWGVKSKMNKK